MSITEVLGSIASRIHPNVIRDGVLYPNTAPDGDWRVAQEGLGAANSVSLCYQDVTISISPLELYNGFIFARKINLYYTTGNDRTKSRYYNLNKIDVYNWHTKGKEKTMADPFAKFSGTIKTVRKGKAKEPPKPATYAARVDKREIMWLYIPREAAEGILGFSGTISHATVSPDPNSGERLIRPCASDANDAIRFFKNGKRSIHWYAKIRRPLNVKTSVTEAISLDAQQFSVQRAVIVTFPPHLLK